MTALDSTVLSGETIRALRSTHTHKHPHTRVHEHGNRMARRPRGRTPAWRHCRGATDGTENVSHKLQALFYNILPSRSRKVPESDARSVRQSLCDFFQSQPVNTQKRFKRTLFIRTKHNMRTFEAVIPFTTRQNDT